MNHSIRFALTLFFVCIISMNGMGTSLETKEALLWPEGAPLAKGDNSEDQPTLTLYNPGEKLKNGCSVVICPGGGYWKIAMDHEGIEVAKWLNAHGITAFILKYRKAPDYQHPAPMLDVKRAIRWVRFHAADFQIDPNKIGILGFSAGGHLASTASTHFDHGDSEASDPIDRRSSRPNFSILLYPVISFTTEYTHQGSKRNLLGENPDSKLVKQFSNELQVKEETPPAFLMHASGDTGVPAENSILYYMALRKMNIPAEMHIFEKGGHGFGLAPEDPVLSQWPGLCIQWMKSRELIKK